MNRPNLRSAVVPLILVLAMSRGLAVDLDNPPIDSDSTSIQSATVTQIEHYPGSLVLMGSETIGGQPDAGGSAGIDGTKPVAIRKDRFGYYVLRFQVFHNCTSNPTVVLADSTGRRWEQQTQQSGTEYFAEFSLIAHQVSLPISVQICTPSSLVALTGTLDGPCSECKSCATGGSGEVTGSLNSAGEGGANGEFSGSFDVGTSDQGDTHTSLAFNIDPTRNLAIGDFKIRSSGGFTRNDSGSFVSTSTVSTDNTITSFESPGGVAVKSYLPGATPTLYRTLAFTNPTTGILRLDLTDHINSATSWQEWRHTAPNKWEHVSGNGLRLEVLTLTTPNGTRVERRKIYEGTTSPVDGSIIAASDASDDGLVSDVQTTYTLYGTQWKKTLDVIAPDQDGLTTTWSYYATGEPTGAASYAGAGLLTTASRHNGQDLHHYSSSSHIVYSGFAGASLIQSRSSTWTAATANSPDTTTAITAITTTTGTVEIAREVTTHTSETATTERRYTGADSYLETQITRFPLGLRFGGRPTRVVHPDKTATVTEAPTVSGGEKTEIVWTGDAGTDGNGVVAEGTRTTTVYAATGLVKSRKSAAFRTSVETVLDDMYVTAADDFGRPTAISWFPAGANGGSPKWTQTFVYNCCGLSSETNTRYGTATTHTYDKLKRPLTSTHHTYDGATMANGITTATRYLGLTTSTHRFAGAGPAGDSNIVSSVTTNLAGTITTSGSPDPSALTNGVGTPGALTPTTTATSYSGGLTTTATTVAGHTQYTVTYPDGRPYQTYGDLSPSMRYVYQTCDAGLRTTIYHLAGVVVGDNGSLTSASEAEPSSVETDWAGRTVATAKGSMTQTYTYNSKGQLEKTEDADHVITLYIYNALGGRETTALKLDAAVGINYGTDQITRTRTIPNTRGSNPVIPVLRTENYTWQDGAGEFSPTLVSYTERTPTGLDTWSWTIGSTGETHTSTTLGLTRVETVTRPDGTTTYTDYAGGLPHTVVHIPSGGGASIATTTYGYEPGLRRLVTTTDRTGTTTITYLSDTCDAVLSVTEENGSTPRITAYTYDSRGNRTKVNAPDSPLAGSGTVVANETVTAYNPDGSVLSVTGDQTYPVSYLYDYAGRMKTMTTSYGTASATATTTWNYDPATGLLLSKLDATNQGPAFAYTSAGRLRTRTTARGLTTTRYYSTGGRLRAIDYSDTTTPDILYGIDRLGRIWQESQGTLTVTNSPPTMAAPARSVSYTYNSTSLALETETHALGGLTRTLVRAYDSLGRPGQVSAGIDSNATPTTLETTEHFTAYRYGTDGRLLGIDAKDVPRFSDKDYGIAYAWWADSLSLVHTITRKGTGSAPNLKTTNLWESSRDVLTSKENKLDSTADPVSKYTYNVNNIGQRQSVATDGTAFGVKPAWIWSYNFRGELVSANDTTANDADLGYIFDAIGNRLATGSVYSINAQGVGVVTNPVAYTPNSLNQYSVAKGVTLPILPAPAPYDPDGNLRFDGGVNKNNEAREYVWDAENRLVEVRNVSVSPAVTLVTYAYDARSRRISRTAGTTTTWYLYDGWNVMAEYTRENTAPLELAKTYTWGLDLSGSLQGAGGVGGLLAVRQFDIQNSTFALYYPTYDGNGNISEYLTGAGATVAHYEYDPFGNDITPNDKKGLLHEAFAHRFSTKPFDPTLSWYYYGYRWYDPLTGRWPSREPIGEQGGLNLYGFVRSDGINWVDILGFNGFTQFINGQKEALRGLATGLKNGITDIGGGVVRTGESLGLSGEARVLEIARENEMALNLLKAVANGKIGELLDKLLKDISDITGDLPECVRYELGIRAQNAALHAVGMVTGKFIMTGMVKQAINAEVEKQIGSKLASGTAAGIGTAVTLYSTQGLLLRLGQAKQMFEAKYPRVAEKIGDSGVTMLYDYLGGAFDDALHLAELKETYRENPEALDRLLLKWYCKCVDGKWVPKSQ
jgi:RHS repeat-associated protein